LKEGIILHLDQGGNPLEIEIIDASKNVSLDEVIFSLPTGRSSAITQRRPSKEREINKLNKN